MNGLRWTLLLSLAFFVWAKWGPMEPLFNEPYSTVLLDREGGSLAASVATDGQWRMPQRDTLPERFVCCLLEFEDRHFHDHWGIHVPSLIRAAKQDLEAGRVVSGGSTITMQLARMARRGRPRTLWNKLIEMSMAVRLELRFSKDELLAQYAAHAPFGGNVVGLEAAAWRWFGRAPDALGWAECATLAVLPNAPSRMHPGRSRQGLLAKRNRLLDRLLDKGTLDTLSWSLAKEEPLPERPHPLPNMAPHLLGTLSQQGYAGQRLRTTVDAQLQVQVSALAERYAPILRANEVYNAAVLVLDVPTGEVLAYVGNLPSADADHAGYVDITQARRSAGSLLKPFLYADMLQSGELMPDQLVADLPTHYEGFSPQNYNEQFEGAVPASLALARSLNVPAVRALHQHGIDRTLQVLRAMGLDHVDRSADDYGLSLIVGGAESTLWELTGAYASMARSLLSGTTSRPVHEPIVLLHGQPRTDGAAASPLSAAALHHTVVALQDLDRPTLEMGWQYFAGSERVAWKTGTSFGHRDGWAIGFTDRYAVGVWTGNADGEGRPGLTGTLAAAPILFHVFDVLPDGQGFDPPYDALERMPVCRSSGYRAGVDCFPVDTAWTIAAALRTPTCPYHQRILVNATGTQRVLPSEQGHSVAWFALPPAMEHFYATSHPGYRMLPSSAHGTDGTHMGMIYPEPGAHLFVPIQLDGHRGRVVLHAAHRDPHAQLNWDLDGTHLGRTVGDHRLAVDLAQGPHRLTLTDQYGAMLQTNFHVTRARPDRSTE